MSVALRLSKGAPSPIPERRTRVSPVTQIDASGVPVRIYRPDRPRGDALLWLHGGGFSGGDLRMPEADWVATTLAARGHLVVTADYRLATDTVRFPAPSDDVLIAWAWLRRNAAELGAPALHTSEAPAPAATSRSAPRFVCATATLSRAPRGRRTPSSWPTPPCTPCNRRRPQRSLRCSSSFLPASAASPTTSRPCTRGSSASRSTGLRPPRFPAWSHRTACPR
ncbi:hypothetical protein GCM10025881_36620 [Pseudolysinimonas kribbensis]|uniref:Alpha/beta hydrolase fold-3 domain-containing protein n=1 Tax=Pseudolysinimonas kribbensis TaxID=433641 RepID=A0ABQ6K868_9MICO|nr:hypothetical protein GCM10025881_36620 [Pseudolysinimonas kribbensis]